MMKRMDTAVVLAGGNSKRMKFNKQSITIGGRLIAVYIADQLSQEFDRVLINSNTPSLYQDSPYEVISDEITGCGPLSGILAGLAASESDYTYFTGCDMPFVNLTYIRYLKKQLNAVSHMTGGILTTTRGLFEPLNAFYSRELTAPIIDQLNMGYRQFYKLYGRAEMLYVPENVVQEFDPDALMFVNLNTMADFEKYLFYGDYYSISAI